MTQLSKDVSVIVAALRKSNAGLLEISADGTKVKRISTVPEKVPDQNARAIYAVCFVNCSDPPAVYDRSIPHTDTHWTARLL